MDSSHGDNVIVDELRRATRFVQPPDEVFAAVWLDGGDAILAEVHDESLGGLGLLLEMGCGIGLGSTVQVVFAKTHYAAQVCHMQPWDDHRLLVGLRCEVSPPR